MKIVIGLLSLLISSVSFSQRTLSSALERLRSNYYTVVENGYCDVAQGGECSFFLTCKSGYKYRIYSSSDDGDVKDVDIWVKNSVDEWVRRDIDELDWAFLEWTQYNTTTYKIVYKNIRSYTPNSRSRLWCVVGEQ